MWVGGTLSVAATPNLSLSLDSVLRFGDSAGGLYEAAFGGVISYSVAKDVQIGGGYQHVIGYTNGRIAREEDRAREQISFPLGGLVGATLTGRARVEERWRSSSAQMGARVRLMVRFTRPLGGKQGPALIGYHESFIELNDTSWGQVAGLRRMRNLVGIEVPLIPKLRGQIAYLNQYDFGANGKRDAMANILMLTIGAKF